jgi:hypothetical protein
LKIGGKGSDDADDSTGVSFTVFPHSLQGEDKAEEAKSFFTPAKAFQEVRMVMRMRMRMMMMMRMRMMMMMMMMMMMTLF